MIDELTITTQTSRPQTGVAVADAEFGNVGREDDPKRYKSNVSVYNTENGELLFRLCGLRYHSLDASNGGHLSHTYMQTIWKPDISLIPKDRVTQFVHSECASERKSNNDSLAEEIGKFIDLFAHKKPSLRLMEASIVDAAKSIWIERVRPIVSEIAAKCQYHFSVTSQNDVLEHRIKYGSYGTMQFSVLDTENPFGDLEEGELFDIVILKVSDRSPALQSAIENAQRIMSDKGYLFLLHDRGSCVISPYADPISFGLHFPFDFESISQTESHDNIKGNSEISYLWSRGAGESESWIPDTQIHLACFQQQEGVKDAATQFLLGRGWKVTNHTLPFNDIPADSTVLVLDEMFSPFISHISDEQFEALQQLIHRKCRILWVTTGAQMNVTLPEQSLFFGVARSLYSEDPTVLLVTLDVESNRGAESMNAIHTSLERLQSVETLEFDDHEFVERDGIIYISRIVPDNPVNQSEKESIYGRDPQVQSLHGHKSCVRLISTRTGTLDSLQYTEVMDESDHIPLGDGVVEVEVHAAAMNFKDLANVIGFVAANEHLVGLECAGFITRVGRDVGSLCVGQRVLVVRRDGGCFANRVTSVVQGVHRIPDWMSFEDASTLGVCYLTVIYSLIDLANTQRGQTVLIHSAAGGVGLAAIQMCKYLGAEVYVTVGSDEKRKFLADTCDIPEDHMFNSRSVKFAAEIMKATNGRGVDIILNSLSGDLLHESWRCIAENGTFIEIGKKDMLERNSLSMEPFSWNASYRAFDLSLKCVTPATFSRLMSAIFTLVDNGHIKPIHIGKTFSFGNIIDAFRYMRGGKHIGKIVITDINRESVNVPIRSALPLLQLKPDVSYLIVGGFKGLCGSLALYLARHGARNLVVISRSGYADDMSKSVIFHLQAMGTHVDLIRGDVTELEDVRRAFHTASNPISGIIQGAMVLRDKVFPSMTAQEFREPIDPKILGTWNLHNTALEQNITLDFFTLLSSVSGVVGQKAQANYSAANVFLDSFAVYRQSMGLQACSVNLGVIEDVGYFVERAHLSRKLEAQGWSLINEAMLHKILRLSILQQSKSPVNPASSTQLITGIPKQLIAASPLQPYHRFSALRPDSGTSNLEIGDSHLTILRNAGKGQKEIDQGTLLASAVEAVNGILMKSLGIKEPLEASRPLDSYGIDSLVAVELRNWVRSELAVEISALEVVGAKTLVALCGVILKKLQG